MLTLGNFANRATITNVETVIGGSGNDAITLGNALTNAMKIDLGTGANALVLVNGANTGTVSNIGTLTGGSGADTITLGTAVATASIDLGAGNDILTLGNFVNSATVANVESITGGTGNDAITLASALTNSVSVDLGAGANKLMLQAAEIPAPSIMSPH